MAKLVARRLLSTIPLVIIVTFVLFLVVDLAPGDPAARLAGEEATPQQIEDVRASLGLEDPVLVRYGRWLGDAAQGDLGNSLATRESVNHLIWERLPVTTSLALIAIVMSVVPGLVLGVAGAMKPGGRLDRMVTVVSSVAIAVPSFWLGLLLVSYFALRLGWFPAIGYEPLSSGLWPWLSHLVLPGIALAALPGAELALQLKAAMVETMHHDYILTAHAKGLPRHRTMLKHALKNAAIPVVTVLGFRVAQMLGGTVVIESIFVLPGLGTLAVNASLNGDIAVLIGLVAVMTIMVIVVNLCVDVSYTYFNPKMRG